MLAATMNDLVIGLDVHFEIVKAVPVPFPMPFVGRITSVNSGPGKSDDSVKINNLPAANVGSVAQLYIPHVCLPPGEGFAPVPMAPVTIGGRTMTGVPAFPPGDAIVAMGSKTVSLRGWPAARMTDLALTCSEPTRMPGSVIALPKGNAVMIGGPPAVDPGAGPVLQLRLPGLANWWRGVGWSVLRDLVHRAARQFTGHPVCVSSGQLFAQAIDFTTPGPLPFVFERRYDSGASDVAGSLGYGWTSALDVEATLHPGEIRVRWIDGRVIPFDTFHRPGHVAHIGDTFTAPTDRSTLRVLAPFRYEVRTAAGAVVELAPCPSGAPRARGVAMRRRDGTGITVTRDARGLARRVTDSAGRPIELSHDEHGRITSIAVPHPVDDACVERVRYTYGARGDLVEVRTADGATTRYEYDRHLLVRETDPTGLSFCFGYDGGTSSACCVRTWGVTSAPERHYDHELTYGKAAGITSVRDSRGAHRLYRSSPLGVVKELIDPIGATVRREWDDRARLVAHTDALGGVTRFEHDERGNLVATTFADGRTTRFVHDESNALVERIDPGGARTTLRYDALGHLVSVADPTGVESRFDYQAGEVSLIESAGSRIEITRDAHGAPVLVRNALGERSTRYDRRGRPTWMRDELGAERRYTWDEADRLVTLEQPDGETVRFAYDACGNVVQQTRFDGPTQVLRAGYHRVVGWRRGELGVHAELDGEDDVSALVDRGSGERFEQVRDATGRVVATRDPDGRQTQWERDAGGRIVARRAEDGRMTQYAYDPVGRLLLARFHDGTELAFEHDARGAIAVVRTTTPSTKLGTGTETRLERDAAGRVTRETTDGLAVDSAWDVRGVRVGLESTLGASVVRAAGVPGVSATLAIATASGQREVSAHVIANERRTELRLPGEVTVVDGLDECGRVVSRSVRRGGRETAALAIERAPGGRPLAFVDPATGPIRFELDVHGRLAGCVFADGTRETRVHDDAGNVFERGDRSGRTYGASGRLDAHDGWTLSYDAEGRLIARTHPSDGAWRFTWDEQGNLLGVDLPSGEKVTHAYDALRRLVRTSSSQRERRFVWDGPRLLHVLSTDEPPVQWVYLPNAITPCARIQAGRWWSLVRWGLGFLVLDEHGAEVGRVSLDLFGRATATSDDVLSLVPFRFPGQHHCEVTGLVHNRFRWYDPSSGLYLSPDPIGLLGGTRPYAYVIDPVTQADPSGLRPCAWIAGMTVELDFVPGFGPIAGMSFVMTSNGQSGIYQYGGAGIGFGMGGSVQALGGFGPSNSEVAGWTGPAVIGSYGPVGGSVSAPAVLDTDPARLAAVRGFRTGTAGLSMGTPSLIAAAPVTGENIAPDVATDLANEAGGAIDQSVVEPAADWLGELDRSMGGSGG